MNNLIAVLSGSLERAPWGWALTGMVLLGLIRVWPLLSKQAIEARTQLRKEKRDDLGDCQRRLDDVNQRLDNMEEKFRRSELHLLGAISAYRILDAEIEAASPGSTSLAQARLVMSAAFTVCPSTEEPLGSAAKP
jgi:hypothetical protein